MHGKPNSSPVLGPASHRRSLGEDDLSLVAAASDSATPLVGFGCDAMAFPIPSIESLSAAYVELIRRVGASGPVRLVGYSFGARVAAQVAASLERTGVQVACLVAIDSPAPVPAPRLLPAPFPLPQRTGQERGTRYRNSDGLLAAMHTARGHSAAAAASAGRGASFGRPRGASEAWGQGPKLDPRRRSDDWAASREGTSRRFSVEERRTLDPAGANASLRASTTLPGVAGKPVALATVVSSGESRTGSSGDRTPMHHACAGHPSARPEDHATDPAAEGSGEEASFHSPLLSPDLKAAGGPPPLDEEHADLLGDLVEHAALLFGADLEDEGVGTDEAVARLGSAEAVCTALANAVEVATGLDAATAADTVASLWAELQSSDAMLSAFTLKRRLRCDVVVVVAVDEDSEQNTAGAGGLLLGWDRATLGRVLLAACPGTHFSVVAQHAAVLAWHLHAVIHGGLAAGGGAWQSAGIGLWRFAKHGHGSRASQRVLAEAAAAAQRAASAVLQGAASESGRATEASRSRAGSLGDFVLSPAPPMPGSAGSDSARARAASFASQFTPPGAPQSLPIRQTPPSPLLAPSAGAASSEMARISRNRAASLATGQGAGELAAATLAASMAIVGRGSDVARLRWSADAADMQ